MSEAVHVTLKLDAGEAKRALGNLSKVALDLKPALLRFRLYMVRETDTMWDRLSYGRGAGTHRGVHWRPFADQYTRKDGTHVPAWGGVPKVRGRGLVQGRLRPSGTRVTMGSAIMQDTGNLRGKAVGILNLTKNRIIMGPEGTPATYAAHQQAMRPFLFFSLPRDLKEAVVIFNRYLYERGVRK